MANSERLRKLRDKTVINLISKPQEKAVIGALIEVEDRLLEQFKVKLDHISNWYLREIVASLREAFPSVNLIYNFTKSSIRPDGGILFLISKDGHRFPILISEVKNQGTNTRRAEEGLKQQAKGNAIERLGKNVIGLKTALLSELIFPFVCFGYGCDFEAQSSILDRVVTIAMFGQLNKTNLFAEGPHGEFQRGSFYFREQEWTKEEMVEVMLDISSRSIQYYFSKYGQKRFELNE